MTGPRPDPEPDGCHAASERWPEGEGRGRPWPQEMEQDVLTDPDLVAHLVQERSVIEQMQAEEISPDAYYDELEPVLKAKFPDADPCLVDHAERVVAAFDVATVFAMSFGVAKFQLAQTRVKLVGELVGREGRSPNPEVVRAIRNWPPIRTLKDLQAFLGTTNYVRSHMGPTYSKVAHP